MGTSAVGGAAGHTFNVSYPGASGPIGRGLPTPGERAFLGQEATRRVVDGTHARFLEAGFVEVSYTRTNTLERREYTHRSVLCSDTGRHGESLASRVKVSLVSVSNAIKQWCSRLLDKIFAPSGAILTKHTKLDHELPVPGQYGRKMMGHDVPLSR